MSQKQQALDNFGNKTEADNFAEQEYQLKDTIFYPVATELTPVDIFVDGDPKDVMYKSKQFPSNTQAFALSHISITTDLQFTVTAATDQLNHLAHFIKSSELIIKEDGNELVRIPVRECMDISIIPSGASDTGDIPNAVRTKFNNKYQLLNPIEIASKKRLDFEFVPAKGLTTAALAANVTPYHPNANFASNRGFIVEVAFTARKIKAA